MSARREKRIGVFDSGFGGIDVLRGIVRELPAYDYVYLGDTARAPYGTRSKETVHAFALQAVDFLFARGCGLIVFACNTASSDALRKIQREYLPKYHPGKKVLGVLVPAAEEAARRTTGGRIGVIATEGTVRSGSFARELAKLDPRLEVFQNACPLLVPIVEAGEQDSKAAKMVLENYLAPLKEKGIDTLILGCTHYGILERDIRAIVGSRVRIVSAAKAVPKRLKDYLKRHGEIERGLRKRNAVGFFTTDLTDKFISLGSRFFGRKIQVEKCELIARGMLKST